MPASYSTQDAHCPLKARDYLVQILIVWSCKSFDFVVVQSLSCVQLLHLYMTTGRTIALIIWTFFGKVMSLLLNTLSRFVVAIPRLNLTPGPTQDWVSPTTYQPCNIGPVTYPPWVKVFSSVK